MKKWYIQFIRLLSTSKKGFMYNYYRRLLGKYYTQDSFKAFNEILWKDGFLSASNKDVCDPTNTDSDYNQGVTFYEVYEKAMKPFFNNFSCILEIGPGRGYFTKGLLPAKEIWCLDAKSLKNNDIFKYLNHPKNVKYIEASDFNCKDLPDNYFDFIFSYGTFVHIPWDGITQYIKNLYSKAKPGAKGIISISDDIKAPENINNKEWYPGCFIPNNSKKMTELLISCGWKVIDENFLKCQRDTIVFFEK